MIRRLLAVLLLCALAVPVLSQDDGSTATEEDPLSFADHLREGDAAIEGESYELAVEHYKRCTEQEPSRAEAWSKRATALQALGRTSKAIDVLTDALNRSDLSTSTQLLDKRGRMRLRVGRLDDAEADFKASGVDASALVGTLRRRLDSARANRDRGRDGAKACLYDTLQIVNKDAPEWAEARLVRAQCARLVEDWAQVHENTVVVLRQKQFQAEALQLRSQAFLMDGDGDMDGAIGELNKVLRYFDPDNKEVRASWKRLKKVKKQLDRAESHESIWQERLDEADKALSNLLEGPERERSPFAGRLQLVRCEALTKLRRHDEAVEDEGGACSVAVQLRPEDARAFGLRGVARMAAKKYDGAVFDFNKAHQFDPRNHEWNRHLQEAKRQQEIASRKDYYEILGVSKRSTSHEVKKAYKKLARKLHPDRFARKSEKEREEAAAKFADINEAHEVLTDDEKRKLFDMGRDPFGKDQQQGGGFRGGNPFGGFGGGGFRFRRG